MYTFVHIIFGHVFGSKGEERVIDSGKLQKALLASNGRMQPCKRCRQPHLSTAAGRSKRK